MTGGYGIKPCCQLWLELGSTALPWAGCSTCRLPTLTPACRLAGSPLLQPGLGDVLMCLLGTLGATQQLLRSTASLTPRQLSLGPWRGNSDSAASASEFHSLSAGHAAAGLRLPALAHVAVCACRLLGCCSKHALCCAVSPPASPSHAPPPPTPPRGCTLCVQAATARSPLMRQPTPCRTP